jgi:aspartate/methionine/tyrosine aminotransferase
MKVSKKAGSFTESVIREMSRVCAKYSAINLAQGFPDFPAPEEIKEAARQAIADDINQYAITWGDRRFREAIAAKTKRFYDLGVDPETQITVCCGATECMIAAMLALVDPGEEVIVFEPFYENYGPDAILLGARPRYVRLREPDWSIDEGELRAAFSDSTAAVVLNTPNNPTGKVFSRAELQLIADLCQEWDAIALTDEIYKHIIFDGAQHIPIATLDGMRDRTVTINSLSKTYSVTGWRVGWTIASEEITRAIRKVHDFLTVGAPAPLQRAGVAACKLPPSYYERLAADYTERRDALLGVLEEVGFRTYKPYGAYYIMTDVAHLGFDDDFECSMHLVRDIGIATVPGSSFYSSPERGRSKIRFCFAKSGETLQAARDALLRGRDRLGRSRKGKRAAGEGLTTLES